MSDLLAMAANASMSLLAEEETGPMIKASSKSPLSILRVLRCFISWHEKAGHPTHFYTLAPSTYGLLPPPETIQVRARRSENRQTCRHPSGFWAA